MDIVKDKFKYKCQKHPDYKLEFMQIDNLNDSKKQKNLFCCSACINQNSNFNQSNYQLIKQIIQQGKDEIIPKWPPVYDNKLIKKLIKISNRSEDIEEIQSQIESYFTDLKDSVIKKINSCQKKMIKYAQELPQNTAQILNRYQELSKIKDLRSILVDKRTDQDEKEKLCRALVENRLSEKNKNTTKLTSLLNDHKKMLSVFNTESAIEIKESILKSISSINLFENPNSRIENKNVLPIQIDYISLLKTDFKSSNIGQQIIKNENNQYKVIIKKQKEKSVYNAVSNIILQNDVKYIFRIQIELTNINNHCLVGLVQDSNMNYQEGFEDSLSYLLYQNENQQISLDVQQLDNAAKQLEGEGFLLSKENEIEMRVCIKDQILEILDFPNYQYKIGLQEHLKHNFINHKHLRLYLGMNSLNNAMTLKEALIVQNFD